jgi:hypothetical protein
MDDPLDAGSSLFALVSEFTEQTKSSDRETLFVIHPARSGCKISKPLSNG